MSVFKFHGLGCDTYREQDFQWPENVKYLPTRNDDLATYISATGLPGDKDGDLQNRQTLFAWR